MTHGSTAEYGKFIRKYESWGSDYFTTLARAHEVLSKVIRDERTNIVVDSFFGFPRDALIDGTGSRAQNDSSNRVKALHDALSKLLMIDDRYFIVGRAENVLLPNGDAPRVFVCLKRAPLRTWDEVLESEISEKTES